MHLVQYFGRIPVARITYTVLVETLNHAQSINQNTCCISVCCCRLFMCTTKRYPRSGSVVHQSRICLLLRQHFPLGDSCMFCAFSVLDVDISCACYF